MQSQCPILVFAQSGRFIAESATRAGYTVRVADCFADLDLQAVAQSWQRLPPLSQLSDNALLNSLSSLSRGEHCLLVCGTGVEAFYPALARLPANIRLVGNQPDSIGLLRCPERFFSLLAQLKLPYPPTALTPPGTGFLFKNMRSAGGTHIQTTQQRDPVEGDYWQQYIAGQTHSACFIADGREAKVLAWNQQINRPGTFSLAHILQPAPPSLSIQTEVEQTLNLLVAASGLKGLNSLDFIVDEADNWFILELNPRISASAELLAEPRLFQIHMAACHGHLTGAEPVSGSQPVRHLSYLFADTHLNIDDKAVWPRQCHDIPAAGRIEQGMPICTIIVEAESIDGCEVASQRIATEVLENCIVSA